MRSHMRLIVLYSLLFCFFVVGHTQANQENLMVTNVTGGQFTVSWITGEYCIGKVKLYSASRFIGDYDDNRGKDFIGTAHYVTVSGLKANTDYTFATDSDDAVDDNDGSYYQVNTGPNLIPAGSIQPAGRVFLSDGHSPAAGTIICVTISGLQGTSAPLSTLVDENGYWYVELINARERNNQKLFSLSEGNDRLIISAKSGEKGSAHFEGPIMDNQGGTSLYAPLILR